VKKKFKTQVAKLEDDRVYMYHIVVPPKIHDFFKEKKQKRLICSIEGLAPYPSAILTVKGGYYYINLNKERLKKLKIQPGAEVVVVLEADTSEYGMPMPPEIEEIFSQDEEVKTVFHKLTPGKQRSLLYIIGKIKTESKRIEKAIIMTNYLKRVNGKLDFKELNQAFKDGL
jgi:hypothetical protein